MTEKVKNNFNQRSYWGAEHNANVSSYTLLNKF